MCSRERKLHQHLRSAGGGEDDAYISADGGGAFTHAAEAVSFSQDGADAVIEHAEAEHGAVAKQFYIAACGARMPHDVGDGFPQAEAEGVGLRVVERGGLNVGGELDAGGGQYFARLRQLGGKAFRPVACYGLANFCECLPGGLLHVLNFSPSHLRVCLEDAVGEVRFDGDGGEGVAEEIVQIAGDALAL